MPLAAQTAQPSTAIPASTTPGTPAPTCTCTPRKPKRRVRHRRVVKKKHAPAPVVEDAPAISPDLVIQKKETPVAPASTGPPMNYPAPPPEGSKIYLPTDGPPPPPPPAPALPAPVPQTGMPAAPMQARKERTNWLMRPDGVPRMLFEAGAGVSQPISAATNSQNEGFAAEVGVGYNFSRYFAMLGRGEYGRAGIPAAQATAQSAKLGRVELGAGTLELLGRLLVVGRFGVYLTGGGGYYRRQSRFFDEASDGTQTEVSRYTMNTLGYNFGGGVEFRTYSRAGLKLFMEARYHYLVGQTPPSGTAYLLNSANTEYATAMAGFRF